MFYLYLDTTCKILFYFYLDDLLYVVFYFSHLFPTTIPTTGQTILRISEKCPGPPVSYRSMRTKTVFRTFFAINTSASVVFFFWQIISILDATSRRQTPVSFHHVGRIPRGVPAVGRRARREFWWNVTVFPATSGIKRRPRKAARAPRNFGKSVPGEGWVGSLSPARVLSTFIGSRKRRVV